jgi:hypothetical protein
MMRELEGRAEALAGTLSAQDVSNMLWAASVFSSFRSPVEGSRWAHTVAKRLISLDKPGVFNTVQLPQLHQFFLWCSVEPTLGVEALNDLQSLKEACRSAFEGKRTAPSAAQQQVSETLRHMGFSVEDEVRCPKSGYSIDLLAISLSHDSVLGMGGERISGGRVWAVEFDGPSHFLASGAPKGATLLKRRHLQLLGHALVSLPYWEWGRCKGAGEREQYLKRKLAACGPSAAQINTHGNR